MPYKDKEKQKAAQARYYLENKESIIKSQNTKRNSWRRIIQEKKGSTPCMDCGIQYPHYVMDFDHVRGVKQFNIAMIPQIPSLEALLDEIDKCDIVCSNCHRHRTFMRRTNDGVYSSGEEAILIRS